MGRNRNAQAVRRREKTMNPHIQFIHNQLETLNQQYKSKQTKKLLEQIDLLLDHLDITIQEEEKQ
jgi:hypothetical protein